MMHLTSELYNLNLQRCDRMTMAHGLEGRVPFLDTDFVRLSFAITPEQKLYRVQPVEKWLLRKTFEDLLPHDVVWRTKEQFSKGAGSADFFAHLADQQINDQAFRAEVEQIFNETGCRIVNKEELFYYREFRKRFINSAVVVLVKRWRGN
jgi:asparagine synthase (glutamine-hydrolysing)